LFGILLLKTPLNLLRIFSSSGRGRKTKTPTSFEAGVLKGMNAV
jgi:hypothetical protein